MRYVTNKFLLIINLILYEYNDFKFLLFAYYQFEINKKISRYVLISECFLLLFNITCSTVFL